MVQATQEYERWLGQHLPLVRADLRYKHLQMATAPFAFMRATFYRFAQSWPVLAGPLAQAPSVPSVGDLHVENYGTWRDQFGRLAWGINDFDEAAPMPYLLDLVRLGLSALLATEGREVQLGSAEVVAAVLEGYRRTLKAGGTPFVLEEEHVWLREQVVPRDPVKFWRKLSDHKALSKPAPAEAAKLLRECLPQGSRIKFFHRTAGLGSLGRARLVALTQYAGGNLAQEAKALAPSAVYWAWQQPEQPPHYAAVLTGACRSADPWLRPQGAYILRRLAPSSRRIELGDLPDKRLGKQFLEYMGAEAANIHLGDPVGVTAVQQHLSQLKEEAVVEVVDRYRAALESDWQDWKKALEKRSQSAKG